MKNANEETVELMHGWMNTQGKAVPKVRWGSYHTRIACNFADWLAERAVQDALNAKSCEQEESASDE